MTTTTKTMAPITNGYDIGHLLETIGVMKDHPEMAKTQFRAVNRWMNGTHNRTLMMDYSLGNTEMTERDAAHVIECDAPTALFGTDKGASPLETLLAALASCITSTLVINAAARGITLHSVKSTCIGNLDLQGLFALSNTVPCGFESIEVKFDIRAEATDEEIDDLLENATEYAPVLSTVRNPLSVTVTRGDLD